MEKPSRLIWTPELHQKFVEAFSALQKNDQNGDDALKCTSKNICDRMGVPGITTKNVASHLQKYRAKIKAGDGLGEGVNELFDLNMPPNDQGSDQEDVHIEPNQPPQGLPEEVPNREVANAATGYKAMNDFYSNKLPDHDDQQE